MESQPITTVGRRSMINLSAHGFGLQLGKSGGQRPDTVNRV
jgi:hypothetical protein